MCQWWGQRPHTESFLSQKNFSWNIKYGKWGDPLTARKENQPTPNGTPGTGWAQTLTVQHGRGFFSADNHGGLSEGEGPQWKLKDIYSEEATYIQLHAALISRCMRQLPLVTWEVEARWWQMKGILWSWSTQAWNPVGVRLLFTGNWHRVITFPRQVGAIVFWHQEKHKIRLSVCLNHAGCTVLSDMYCVLQLGVSLKSLPGEQRVGVIVNHG